MLKQVKRKIVGLYNKIRRIMADILELPDPHMSSINLRTLKSTR